MSANRNRKTASTVFNHCSLAIALCQSRSEIAQLLGFQLNRDLFQAGLQSLVTKLLSRHIDTLEHHLEAQDLFIGRPRFERCVLSVAR